MVADPHNLPRWWPAVERVEDADTSAWTSVMRSPKGKLLRADFTRVSLEAERSIEWRQELEETPFERIMSLAVTRISLYPAGRRSHAGGAAASGRSSAACRGSGDSWCGWQPRRQLDEALDGLERIA